MQNGKIQIQDILSRIGYNTEGLTNRKRNVRSINGVLNNSEIEIKIAPKGMHFTSKDGKIKSTVKLMLKKDEATTYCTRFYIKDLTDTYMLLKCFAEFLKREEVKAKLYADVQTPHTCRKCNGTGFITQFAWYAEGVCFDCMGAGITGVLRIKCGKYGFNL